MNYYNEFDPKAAAWLRELIKEGHIAAGEVDERSIADVRPDELRGFRQCHFFAGIGGWSYALRLAGWSDDKPVWTGSCPCQPFSAAGLRLGTADDRHLWPVWFDLIAQCRPPVVFGEQVASKDALGWLDGVSLDLEGAGYAVGAADLCSAGVGSPNIRQRIYWLADASGSRSLPGTHGGIHRGEEGAGARDGEPQRSGTDCGLANPDGWDASAEREQPSGQHGQQQEDGIVGRLEHSAGDRRQQRGTESDGRGITSGCSIGGLGNADDQGPQGRGLRSDGDAGQRTPWAAGTVLIPCTDGKQRRIKPGIFPLAPGIPGRVGLLRGAGNAINPYVAKEFIESYLETLSHA